MKYSLLKKSAACLLAAALSFAVSGCASPRQASDNCASPSPSLDDLYKIEKVNEIRDKIIGRETVESDYYLYYIPDSQLADMVKEYNKLTAEMTYYFNRMSIGICAALLNIEDTTNPPSYAHAALPKEVHEMEARMTHLALYENCDELYRTDPLFMEHLTIEAGGSYGMWAYRMHDNLDAGAQQTLTKYFELIEQLTSALSGYALSLSE